MATARVVELPPDLIDFLEYIGHYADIVESACHPVERSRPPKWKWDIATRINSPKRVRRSGANSVGHCGSVDMGATSGPGPERVV